MNKINFVRLFKDSGKVVRTFVNTILLSALSVSVDRIKTPAVLTPAFLMRYFFAS